MSVRDNTSPERERPDEKNEDDDRIERLIDKLVKCQSSKERIKAAEALGKIGEPAIEPLIVALEKERWDVRSSAIMVLERIGQPAARAFQIALTDDDWFVRASAAKALGQIKAHTAVNSLIDCLSDKDWFVRERAAEALGKIGEPAIEPLIAALKDRNGFVRERAAEILGAIGNGRALRPLMEVFNDDELYVRARAVLAFERVKKRLDGS
ncbi:MAG: HEAT repeat domain-containing protein [Halobacteriota archaeon]